MSTIWKKNVFSSDTDNIENNKHPDILEMENKLKKINKRKKSNENFKNIEELQNIYESKEEKDKNIEKDEKYKKYNKKKEKKRELENKEESLKESLTNDIFKCSKPENNDKETIKEGFNGKNYNDSKKKPVEPKDSGNSDYFFLYMKYLSDITLYYIFYPYDTFIKSIYNFNYKIVKQYSSQGDNNNINLDFSNKGIIDNINSEFSEKKKSKTTKNKIENSPNYKKKFEKDASILTDIIISIIIFPLLYIITYNWFYLICYYNKDSDICTNKREEDDFIKCRPANDSIRTPITFSKSEELGYYFNFFFSYLITPLAFIDKILMGETINPLNIINEYNEEKYILYDSSFTIPNFLFFTEKMLKTVNLPSRTLHKIIVTTICYYILYNASFFSSIKESSNINTANLFICMIILGFHYFRTIFQYCLEIKERTIDNPNFPLTAISILICCFLCILVVFFRFVIGFFSLTLSYIIVIVFLWYHSLFGIYHYKLSINSDFISYLDTFKNIDTFINKDIEYLKMNEDCKDTNILIKIFKYLIRTFSGNILNIFFIILLFQNLYKTYIINSLNIQFGTQIILLLIIIISFIKMFFFTSTE